MNSVQSILRIYMVATCILVIFIEMEWTSFIRDSNILRNWITRGLLYAFLGLVGMEANDTEEPGFASSQKDAIVEFVNISAYIMVGVGVLYYLMGCLCLQMLRDKVVEDYEKRRDGLSEAQKKGQKIAPIS